MGAATKIYVKVLATHEEWREVSAVTLRDAMDNAKEMPRVVDAIEAQYEKPKELDWWD